MVNQDIYKDISERTKGDIYIGVVGPVRTGKSTFIKRFMDMLVIPNIENEYSRERTKDELPQSGTGKSIMTTEPKFIPNEAVEITLNEEINLKVRMIDCVGYMVKGAIGDLENNNPRMVHTPWFEKEIPFIEAAEIGTKKVITDHSTIGIVITTDGSFTDIDREDYEMPEERVIEELKQLNKPFVILLNTVNPYSQETQFLAEQLTDKYKVPVMPINCSQLKKDDINLILEKILYEFPIQEVKFYLPKWIESLENDHWLKKDIIKNVKNNVYPVFKIREIKENIPLLEDSEFIKKTYINRIDLGEGITKIEIALRDDLFYQIIAETTGMEIEGDHQLISILKKLSKIKKEYDKISFALDEVKEKGYGIVIPMLEELSLEDPEIIKQGNKFGVKLKASAPSIHLIRANIETEVSPLVGTEKQSEELLNYLINEFESDPSKIWESNIFGKSLHDLVNEELQNKIYKMSEDSRYKLQETLQKIINDGNGGLICIIL